MFLQLFHKECQKMMKCITYYIFVICLVLFYFTQMGVISIEKPNPNQESYGNQYSNDATIIMNATINNLVREYVYNRYITYPIGFYKEVILSGRKYKKMSEILSEVTGLPITEVEKLNEAYFLETYEEINPPNELTYELFLEHMKKADKILGGGSAYSEDFMKSNVRVPVTYEEALANYNLILEKDKITGAFARLFSDYMGIILGILPVFMAVTRGLRDKRAQVEQVIYAHSISSKNVIVSRYLAMVVMMTLPVVILSILPTMQGIYYGKSLGESVDVFAFIKYIIGWLIPTIMITTSVGVFITELTETAFAIVIQGIWWFVSLFMGVGNLVGNYGWNLMPRHNSVGNYQLFINNIDMLIVNRLTYTIAAILILILTIVVYENKRKGRLLANGKLISNRKSKF